ncbi:glucokinase [Agromyces flavus]|uniref:Glucokinase n=1 Tax=Agromyces flavus TaxID=589382 RepID=A0A1H1WI49_9MICO|nr:ROK family protein [Agromyces flavus]MCP2366178.1 glucokinase [Agromyces flavus]GGI44156.1 sugar kinase [Agromyces flavus]SDS96692.1 glucokinase [Agromyces flavus]
MSESGAGDVALAVDIGGTKVDAALVDVSGRIISGSRHRAATGPGQTPDTFSAAIASVCRQAADAAGPAHRLVGVGIGAAGPLRGDGTRISPLNLPGIRDFAVVEPVAAIARGLPVRVALDGTCIALAELEFGALRGVRNGLAMVVSTGIGGGIVLDGRVIRGDTGNAGHVGQVWVRRPGDIDPERASVEGVASGPATVRWANAHGWTGADGLELARAYRSGDPVATRAVRRSAEAVGQAISGYAALLDLRVAAIGGGFSRVADDYLPLVEAAARGAALLPAAAELRVVPAELGDDAPLVGAALLVHRGA